MVPLVLVTCLALGLLSPAAAQVNPLKSRVSRMPTGEQSYSMEGQVLVRGSESGLQTAQVTLTDLTGVVRGCSYTDDSGIFAFYDLPSGRYTLTVSHPEFEEQHRAVEIYGGALIGLRIVLQGKQSVRETTADQPVAVWALRIPPKAERAYRRGLKELEKGKVQKSVGHFEAALQVYPEFASARSALGAAYLKLGRTEEAEAAFEQALTIDQNLPDACLVLGGLYSGQERVEEAEPLLRRARQLKPDDWRVHYELGQLYWRAEQWGEAEESLRQALLLHAGFPRLHLLLINALAWQEKYRETLAAMDNFLRRFPRDSFAQQVREKRDLLKAHLQQEWALPQEP